MRPRSSSCDKILMRVLGQEAEPSEVGAVARAGGGVRRAVAGGLQRGGAGASSSAGSSTRSAGLVQGVSGAVNSPQGRALDRRRHAAGPGRAPGRRRRHRQRHRPGRRNADRAPPRLGRELAVRDGVRWAEPRAGAEFEVARRVVRLASAAARDVATAPPGAPPELVGELACSAPPGTSRGRCSAAPCAPSRRSRGATTATDGYRRLPGRLPAATAAVRRTGGYGAVTGATGPVTGADTGRRYGPLRVRVPGALPAARRAAPGPSSRRAGPAAGAGAAAPAAAARLPLGRGADRRACSARRRRRGLVPSCAAAGTRRRGAERVRLTTARVRGYGRWGWRPAVPATAAGGGGPARSQRSLGPPRRQDHRPGRVSR